MRVGASMQRTTLQTSSGLLPDDVYEVALEPDGLHGWQATCGYRGDRANQVFEFVGGADPRAWLAFKLASEHGFSEESAVRAARELFSVFLPDAVGGDDQATPYGMPP